MTIANGSAGESYEERLLAIGDWVCATPLEGDADHAARRLLLDTLACAIAGMRKVDLRYLGGDASAKSGAAHVILGAPSGLGPAEAAYVVALAACADEACEGLAFAHGRPGLHAVAAAVGAALRVDASLGQMLAAIAAGFEFGGRMGGLFRAKPGVHVDGTWGLVAATVAARRLYGQADGAALAAAAAAALCQMPASLYLPVSQGADVRNSYSAHAASAGVLLAASLATGMTTPAGAVDAAGGYAFNRDDAAWVGPGRRLLLEGYLKPYPSVRHTHYGVEAARSWRRQHPDTPIADVSAALEIYPEAVTYCGNRAPVSPIMAQFSLSYTLAAALAHGDLTPAAYEPDVLHDPDITALERRVRTEPVEALGRDGQRAARLTVESGGAPWSQQIDRVPGDAAQPLTDAEVIAKARLYCRGRLDDARADRLIREVMQGPAGRPVSDLLSA
tara:strand:- start:1331 stop:2671 length:1341 start_codon:yes stop_codon:yes gene_type:complete